MSAHKSLRLVAAAGIFAIGAVGGLPAQVRADIPEIATQQKAIKDWHQSVVASLVRVTVIQSPASVLDPALRKEFDERYRAGTIAATPGGGRGRGSGNRNAGDGSQGPNTPGAAGGRGGPGAPGGGYGGGGGRGGYGPNTMVGAVKSFLQNKIENTKDPQEADHLRSLALRVDLNRDGFQGELSAVVLDTDGHVLLPVGLLREAHTDPLSAALPDGSPIKASFIGANLYSGYTVLQLAGAKNAKPIKLAHQKIEPLDMLLFEPVGQSWPSVVFGSRGPGGEERFNGPGDDRSGAFIFNTNGELSAVMPAGPQVLSASRLQKEIDFIEKGKGGSPTDIEPRNLGVNFSPLSTAESTRLGAATVLGARRAVKVVTVQPKSLASAADLKPNDILVTLDKRPISDLVSPEGRQLPDFLQLRLDLTMRTDAVPLTVIRDGKELQLTMPLQ